MNRKEFEIVKDRLNTILQSLRFQNSGCDTHTVGNIRNTVTMLLEQMDDDPNCINDNLVYDILKNQEKALIDFFKKKYQSEWSHKQDRMDARADRLDSRHDRSDARHDRQDAKQDRLEGHSQKDVDSHSPSPTDTNRPKPEDPI